jgi:hypothetical protein
MGPSNGAVYLEPRVHAAENTSNKGNEKTRKWYNSVPSMGSNIVQCRVEVSGAKARKSVDVKKVAIFKKLRECS